MSASRQRAIALLSTLALVSACASIPDNSQSPYPAGNPAGETEIHEDNRAESNTGIIVMVAVGVALLVALAAGEIGDSVSDAISP